MLDRLQDLNLLEWRWDYANSSAIYWVTLPGESRRKLDTKRAEQLALKLCAQQGIVWLPVPHPGGETQLIATLHKIAELQGRQSVELPATPTPKPIDPTAFNLDRFPELRERLQDDPSENRSAQTYALTRACIERGLSNGEIKWFLAQYGPFRGKFAGRSDSDRELDRVIRQARADAVQQP